MVVGKPYKKFANRVCNLVTQDLTARFQDWTEFSGGTRGTGRVMLHKLSRCMPDFILIRQGSLLFDESFDENRTKDRSPQGITLFTGMETVPPVKITPRFSTRIQHCGAHVDELHLRLGSAEIRCDLVGPLLFLPLLPSPWCRLH